MYSPQSPEGYRLGCTYEQLAIISEGSAACFWRALQEHSATTMQTQREDFENTTEDFENTTEDFENTTGYFENTTAPCCKHNAKFHKHTRAFSQHIDADSRNT